MLFFILALLLTLNTAAALGSAATPINKQSVAVLGPGGYHGSLVFGMLQRAGNLYGTGINANTLAAIGGCADTAVQLNRRLGMHFQWAHANEACIKLTDIYSADAIARKLQNCDALVLATNLQFKNRAVTAGTYEKSPNDKIMEVYWGEMMGAEPDQILAEQVLQNVINAAASDSTNIKHVVLVDDLTIDINKLLDSCNLPCTRIVPMSVQALQRYSLDYAFSDGIRSNLSISNNEPEQPSNEPVYIEDIAALAVQCLQSLDWNKSRTIYVTSNGKLSDTLSKKKRLDQEWCVNSDVLAAKIEKVE